ncbi:hypothetical protein AB0J01_28255 [Streptomyces sp. NPDC050204]|uniref:hypothetical protein n=1 Tax=Streptomyces sp. NPDC050204 TaxID=3155514 RepID=UPI003447D8EB
MTTVLVALAALAVGYGLGRWQPYVRLAEWANWQLRLSLHRWTSRPRQAVLFVLLLVTDPVRTVRAWRGRHDPPPPKAPSTGFREVPPASEESVW